MPRDGFGCLHTEDISGHISSCSRSLFLPARVLSFVLLSRVLFLPARVLSFVLLSRVLSFLSSCSRSFFRPFISRFFLLSRFSSFCLAFRPFISRFVLLEFIFLNKSPSKICIYQKFVVPLHSNLNILVRD